MTQSFVKLRCVVYWFNLETAEVAVVAEADRQDLRDLFHKLRSKT